MDIVERECDHPSADSVRRRAREHRDIANSPTGVMGDAYHLCTSRVLLSLIARIEDLEGVEKKSRGYRVGHIAGFHAGIRAAADKVREWQAFTKHAQEPIAEEMAQEVLALEPKDFGEVRSMPKKA